MMEKTQEKKKVKKTIDYDKYAERGSMDLDTCYEQTVAELGLQQSKRDQIIAFYLTILGFVIPSVISLEIADEAKAVAFFALYAIGTIFAHVILRYRIYKEVYWIACRVLTQLYNIKEEERNQEVIYTLYYRALEKNRSSIVQHWDKEKRWKSVLKSFWKQLNSAETLLFETLVLFSMFVGLIGAWHLWEMYPMLAKGAIVLLLLMVVLVNYRYVKRLMDLYKCVDTELEEDLMIPFGKAWMLHCFVDDIIEKKEEILQEVPVVEKKKRKVRGYRKS